MAKCSLVGCTNKVIGGFQKTIDAGNFENPAATIPGMKTLWCRDHEDILNIGLGRGRYLIARELKES